MLYILCFVENHKSHVESLFRELNSKSHVLKAIAQLYSLTQRL